MELNKQKWTKKDIAEFNDYLFSLNHLQTAKWTQKIYSTQKECLAIKVPVLRDIAKEISKGDAISFFNLQSHKYIEDDILIACVISLLKDYSLQKSQTTEFLKNVDSWVCTDTLKLNDKKEPFENVYNFSYNLLQSKYLYLRRFAFVQLLKCAKNKECINKMFGLVELAHLEQEYYVNMAIAWLLCEIMIFYPAETLKFLNNYKNKYKETNNIFVLKKTISKCRDSFRISEENKILLKKLL